MDKRQTAQKEEPLRVAATVVMDVEVLEKAMAKAEQHGISLTRLLERAVRLYGRVLDKKVVVLNRPL